MPKGVYERTERHRAIARENGRKAKPPEWTPAQRRVLSEAMQAYRRDHPRLRPAAERFAEKVSVQPDGCHLWTGSVNEKGYGTFKAVPGKPPVRAHIWADNQAHGPIPPGLERDHTCEVRRCVNPDHIDRVTHAENLRRMRERRAA